MRPSRHAEKTVRLRALRLARDQADKKTAGPNAGDQGVPGWRLHGLKRNTTRGQRSGHDDRARRLEPSPLMEDI